MLAGPGCLAWTPPVVDDDDSGEDAVDDDDTTTGDDDDTTTGDDDDTTAGDDDDSVSLEANGAVVLVLASNLGTGTATGGVATAVFSSGALSPSAEEAAFEDVVGLPILTFAAPGDYRESTGDLYDATYLAGADDIVLTGEAGSLAMQAAPNGWIASEIDHAWVGPDSPWSAQIDQGPFAGTHDAPAMPTLPVLSSARLLDRVLYLHPSTDAVLEIGPEEGTQDVLSLLGGIEGEAPRSRTYSVDADGLVRVEGLGGLVSDEGAQLFLQRTARTMVDVDGQPLLMVSSRFAIGSVWPLGFEDAFLSPQNTVAWTDPVGTTVAFQVDPAVLGEGSTHAIQVGSSQTQATYTGGQLLVEVDPAGLGFGWVTVEMDLPSGGMGRGAFQVAGAGPQCDVSEAGQNGSIASAMQINAGQVVCGTIDPAGDLDVFRIQATLGVTYSFEIWAQRLGAETDSYISVFDASGNPIADNDDSFGLDSQLEVTATQQGPLFVQVREYDPTRAGPNVFWRLVTSSVSSTL